jgi:hypothetical protein
VKLLALLLTLAALIHGHATVAGAAIDVRTAVLVTLLTLCAALVAALARPVLAFRSSPCVRRIAWSCP